MVGQTIGKYRVVSRLGRGGMGTVYKAIDATLEREVAIKCLNPDLGDPEILKRFRAEAITLARLNHPSIATLFELTEHDGQLLMVMEFVRGETFEHLSRCSGPLPVDRAAQLCSQVLDALGHAHRAGIVHRDLKPANLMLTESGLTKVMDFGLARVAGTEHLTNDGFMVGTPAYMAPEQVLAREIDGRADLYAMGVVLFRLLTAQLPFTAESGIAMVQKQLHDQPTPARQLRQDLPAACDAILARALAKAPQDRFQTAEDFRTALVALGAPVSGISASFAAPSRMLLVPAAAAPTRAHTPSPAASRTPNVTPSLRPAAPFKPTPAPAARPSVSAVESAPTVMIPAPARRSNVVAIAAVSAMLFAGMTTAFMIWRGRHTADTVASAEFGGAVPAPVAANELAGRPSGPDTSALAAASSAVAAGGTAAGRRTPGATPASLTAPVAAASAPAIPLRASAVVTFANMKLLLNDGGKSRDRDTSLRLGAQGLEVVDGAATLRRAEYRDVIGLFHSHSREPKWAAPDGTPIAVAKMEGRFGFLKGVPDWVTVRTKRAFIPLRVSAEDLEKVIAALEFRTGTRVVRTR